jgi:trehalose 6-phosphate synthase
MRLSLRFIIRLVLALAVIAYAVVPLVDQLTVRWFVRDLDIRSALVASTIQEQLQEPVRNGTKAKMLRFFNKLTQDERLYAVGFCDGAQEQLVSTQTYPQDFGCMELNEKMAGGTPLLPSAKGLLHISVQKIVDRPFLLSSY